MILLARIRTRREWGAVHDDGAGAGALPAYEGAFLHHSDGPARNGVDPIRTLERIGEERFGAGISYTFPITPDGTIYQGHSIDRQGTHTKGYNTAARAIVLVGDFTDADPTPEQIESAARLLAHGKSARWWPTTQLRPHHAVRATACPARATAAIPTIVRRAVELLHGAPTQEDPLSALTDAQARKLAADATVAAVTAVATLNIVKKLAGELLAPEGRDGTTRADRVAAILTELDHDVDEVLERLADLEQGRG